MFESIEQLEKDVKDFRDNILASSELIKGLEYLSNAISEQKDSFSANSSNLLKELGALPIELESRNRIIVEEINKNTSKLSSIVKAITEELSTSNKIYIDKIADTIDSIKQTFIKEMEITAKLIKQTEAGLADKYEDFLSNLESTSRETTEKLNVNNGRHLNNVISAIQTTQETYLQKMDIANKSIVQMEVELASKYKDFLNKLELTNVEQVYKICQDIKMSVEKKCRLQLVIGSTLFVLMVLILLIK